MEILGWKEGLGGWARSVIKVGGSEGKVFECEL